MQQCAAIPPVCDGPTADTRSIAGPLGLQAGGIPVRPPQRLAMHVWLPTLRAERALLKGLYPEVEGVHSYTLLAWKCLLDEHVY